MDVDMLIFPIARYALCLETELSKQEANKTGE
jgi:hypothetical protein